MPQLLPLVEGGELPLYLRRQPEETNWAVAFSRKWRGLQRRQRSLIIAVSLLVVLGFGYVQLYSFSGVIEDVEKNEAAEIVRQHEQEAAKAEAAAESAPALPVVQELPVPDAPGGNSAEEQVIEHKKQQPNEYPEFKGPQNDRQKAVVAAMKHSWAGYKKFAWGKDTLMPISGRSQDWMDCGLTIIDSLDTLIIMGLEDEFKESLDWINKELSFAKDRFVNLFETTIRVLGGLLSAYHLTGHKILLDKAEDVGSRLIGGVKSPSPVPYSDVNLKTGEGKQPAWGGESSLSEVTSIQLEFRDLARLIKNQSYEDMTFNVSKHIHELGCKDHHGLCGMFLSATTGQFKKDTTITLGARSDSYYEYLLKQWLQTGKTIPWLLDDYIESMAGVHTLLWRYSEPNKFAFPGELLGGKGFSPKMDHLVCFLAGTLALGTTAHDMPPEHLQMAKELGASCREMYRTRTGMAPEIVYFNQLPGTKDDISIKPLDAHCLLRPEAFEAWFYLYRVTGDPQYQEWGWEAFTALEQFAKVENGYSSVNSVKKIPVTYRDMMESFFTAETLKYLYLLFADDQSDIPLDKYVFNTEGHPLPIRSN